MAGDFSGCYLWLGQGKNIATFMHFCLVHTSAPSISPMLLIVTAGVSSFGVGLRMDMHTYAEFKPVN